MWPSDRSDVCLNVFCRAMTAWDMPFLPGQSVVEIGCSEADWIAMARDHEPTLRITGIDTRQAKRPDADLVIHGDLRDYHPQPGSVDWVVMVSTLEHIGLGHYRDPVFDDGDGVTLEHVWGWLRPGGSVYFDIPWLVNEASFRPNTVETPPHGGYREGTSHRIYTPDRIGWLQTAHPWTERRVLCHPDPDEHQDKAWVYRAHWWMKDGETGSV